MEIYLHPTTYPAHPISIPSDRYNSEWRVCLEIVGIAMLVMAVALSAFVDPFFFAFMLIASGLTVWIYCACSDEIVDEPTAQKTNTFALSNWQEPLDVDFEHAIELSILQARIEHQDGELRELRMRIQDLEIERYTSTPQSQSPALLQTVIHPIHPSSPAYATMQRMQLVTQYFFSPHGDHDSSV